MLTTSEIAVTITTWVLATTGTFFGTRAAWRRSRKKSAERQALPRVSTELPTRPALSIHGKLHPQESA
jgi:hypothetical protein